MALKMIPINATLEQRLVKCGKARCNRCKHGASHGPYWFATWKEGGEMKHRYVGKSLGGTGFAKTGSTGPKARAMWEGFAKTSPAAVERAALALIRRNANGRTGLAFVPAIVRDLGGPAVAHPVLEQLSRDGKIELRPESGLGRITAEDLALCVPGPQRSRLSWARVVS